MTLYIPKAVIATQWFKLGDVSADWDKAVEYAEPVVLALENGQMEPPCASCDALVWHGLLMNARDCFGHTRVCPGDWIITDGSGHWVCKPDVFERFYEATS